MAQSGEKYDLEVLLKEIEEDEGKKSAEKPRAMTQSEIMKMLKERKNKGKANE